MRWQAGVDDAGAAHTVDDPLAARTATALDGTTSAAERVAALLELDAIFPVELASDAAFAGVLNEWLRILEDEGAQAARERIVRQPQIGRSQWVEKGG